MTEQSPATTMVEALVRAIGKEGAHLFVDALRDRCTVSELAAVGARWPFWARPKQIAPRHRWRSWGFLAGRGMGKTRACSEFVNDEVQSGRLSLIGLAAQNEDKSIEVQITGKSGLIKTAPPWFRPTWIASAKQLVWPNGAKASVLTPEVPGAIRGPEFDLCWLTELQSWPTATRKEAFSNFQFSTRLGLARMIWDATPKRGHEILIGLLARADRDPQNHIVVRGHSRENAANLSDGILEELERDYGGTAKGREELGGEMLTEGENPVAKQEWIDRNRRRRPDRFLRKGLGIDPAITERKGSDNTGIVLAGLGVDRQALIMGDRSGKYDPPTWTNLTLDVYVAEECDVIVVETNRGGSLVTASIRAAAEKRQLEVIVLEEKDRPPGRKGIVYVKERHSRGPKQDRAQPVSTAYEANRISHVIGVDLTSLELTLTTWEPMPGENSPDDLDAEVLIVSELLELGGPQKDLSKGFPGIDEISRQLQQTGAGGELVAIPTANELLAALDAIARGRVL